MTQGQTTQGQTTKGRKRDIGSKNVSKGQFFLILKSVTVYLLLFWVRLVKKLSGPSAAARTG